jgi:hypothetical protein
MSQEMSDRIQKNVRPFKEPDWNDIPIEVIQYAAGFSDTDGCFQIHNNSPSFHISQAEKGVDALHFMHNHFGGAIYLHKEGNEKHQTSYDWKLTRQNAIEYSKLLIPHLLIKKREAEVIINFVTGKTMFNVEAYDNETGEMLQFKTATDCARHFGLAKSIIEKLPLSYGSWNIKRKYSEEEIQNIQDERNKIDTKLKQFKKTPHDEIPEDTIPSIPWRAGVIDGEGCLFVNGKSGQHHSITQKYKPLLEVFQRLYGGSLWYRKGSNTYGWDVYTEARKMLTEIAPYLQGKKKQADIILNMQPGEAPKVHLLLRELKGNYTAPTPSIDALKNGAPGIKPSQTKPHTPPKELPCGIFFYSENKKRVFAKIQYENKVYCLGVFNRENVTEAEQLYLKYKNDIAAEKRGGAKVDFTNIHTMKDRNSSKSIT